MIHLQGKDPSVTLCGMSVTQYKRRDGSFVERKKPLTTTNNCSKHECDRCHASDERRQIVQYAADCKAAGVKYGEL